MPDSLYFIRALSKYILKRTHPVYCAWCAAKNKFTICGVSQVSGSSGICPECFDKFFENDNQISND